MLAAGIVTREGSARSRPMGFFAEHDLPIGLQLYMLGEVAKSDLEGSLKRVAKIGYRTIELPGVRAGMAVQAREAADKAGLAITSVHLNANEALAQGMMTIQADAGVIADEMHKLGCQDVVVAFPVLPKVVPGTGEDMMTAMRRAFRTSTDHWKRTAELLNERGAALQREGLKLNYHNHDLEFLPVNSIRGWDILIAETDPKLVSFELDVAWLVAAGQDSVSLIETLGERVRQLHVKDLLEPSRTREALKMESTEVGSGIIDWKKLLPTAYRAGVRQFYVEQEPPYKIDRFEAAKKSYTYLKSL